MLPVESIVTSYKLTLVCKVTESEQWELSKRYMQDKACNYVCCSRLQSESGIYRLSSSLILMKKSVRR